MIVSIQFRHSLTPFHLFLLIPKCTCRTGQARFAIFCSFCFLDSLAVAAQFLAIFCSWGHQCAFCYRPGWWNCTSNRHFMPVPTHRPSSYLFCRHLNKQFWVSTRRKRGKSFILTQLRKARTPRRNKKQSYNVHTRRIKHLVYRWLLDWTCDDHMAFGCLSKSLC